MVVELAQNSVLQLELVPVTTSGVVDIAALPQAFHEFFAIEEEE